MRAHGEGTIYQLPSGKWRAQVSVGGKRLSVTRRYKKECVEWLEKTRGQIKTGLTYEGARAVFGPFMREWLNAKSGDLAEQTFEQYNRIAKKHILPHLGKVRIKELTPARVQAYLDDLRNDSLGLRTIEIAYTILHGCLDHACTLGLTPVNPSDKVIISRPKKAEMKVWNEAQVSQFLVSIRDHRHEVLFALVLATGMRRGEVLGLKWSDIDWQARKVSVQRQVYRSKSGEYKFKGPKSERGIRSIELGSNMIERLRDQMAMIYEMHRRIADKWQDWDLVFPSRDGSPIAGETISTSFRTATKRSGLPQIRFHDMRHTAASLMLSHGIPPLVVAGILGHSLAVLQARYAHFIPSMQSEAAALMDSLTKPVEVGLLEGTNFSPMVLQLWNIPIQILEM